MSKFDLDSDIRKYRMTAPDTEEDRKTLDMEPAQQQRRIGGEGRTRELGVYCMCRETL